MGVYDTIRINDREGQVKCFAHEEESMECYSVGDCVGTVWISGEEVINYSIAMREGGFINIADGIVRSWADSPKHKVVIDKWGGLFDVSQDGPDTEGLIGTEKYFFSDMAQIKEITQDKAIEVADKMCKAVNELLDVIYENPLRIGSKLAEFKPSGDLTAEELGKLTAVADAIEEYQRVRGMKKGEKDVRDKRS